MAKKEKKVKEPKPKKEKKVKEKKVKEPKPKKEKKKKGAAPGEEGGEEVKKGGKKKLLMILVPVVLVAAAGGVLMFTGILGGGRDSGDGEPAGEEEVLPSPEETGDGETEGGEDGEDAGTQPEGEIGGEESGRAAASTLQIQSSMTTGEIVSFMESLPPDALGLEGEDLSSYEVYASEGVTLVDGQTCTQVRIYSRGEKSGTNDVEGIYYLTRSGVRHLYRYDLETGAVTEIPLDFLRPAPEPTEAPEEEAEPEEGEES